MDWEHYQRYRATVMLAGVVLVSTVFLIFQRTAAVRYLRTFLVVATLPTERFLSQLKTPVETRLPSPGADSPETDASVSPSVPSWGVEAESRRTLQVLRQENDRLRELLALRTHRWSHAVAAHVVGRDPQRWFQELVLDKGKSDGVATDDPVIAIVDGREGLVGRITDVSDHVSKVMLIQDSLSAVAVTVLGSVAEDGVVEGGNSHDLVLKYLDRSSHAKIGDPVITSGLGKTFPEGIPVGWIQDIALDPRQLFLQAQLRPAVQANRIHVVLILARQTPGVPE